MCTSAQGWIKKNIRESPRLVVKTTLARASQTPESAAAASVSDAAEDEGGADGKQSHD